MFININLHQKQFRGSHLQRSQIHKHSSMLDCIMSPVSKCITLRYAKDYIKYVWFKYNLGQKYQASQGRPDWGSNSWPPDHDSTFHVTETPALTTRPSVTYRLSCHQWNSLSYNWYVKGSIITWPHTNSQFYQQFTVVFWSGPLKLASYTPHAILFPGRQACPADHPHKQLTLVDDYHVLDGLCKGVHYGT